ncbi:MAG TPA: RNA methyltransferase [Thermoanaerobaculia bacterium]|jgi:TrmH family RNA methyltransferase|nr:RNA methyltransferase [Thermoanaerobaculia bacterium]
MAKLGIVLVEPREAGNVGAVARVMKNFGFDDLRIVGDHPPLLPVAGWWASGADDLLERIRFAATLQEALADAHLTIATTSMRGRTTPADFTPLELAAQAASEQTIALVFGREDSGLTREELALCQRTAVIPTSERFPTMNLAQAVGVFCFALSSIPRGAAMRDLATAALIERLHERLESLLLEVGFLHANNPDRIYDDIRALLGRAALDEREATILLGMVRQIEWSVRR